MPQNYSVPEGLKIFLSSMKSEIQDHRNRNQVKCNIPNDEVQALKELVRLQRERKIVIKACDKGAGLIILNFEDYMKECYIHLNSKNSNGKPYYSEVDDIALDQAKHNIKSILDKALEDKYISRKEYLAMLAEDKKPGRFYINLKVHKAHEHIPPPRPIISASGSITENIGRFVEFHIHSESVKHETYIEDTPDFLRIVERINHGQKLHPKTMAVTADVSSLFTNIIHKEGLKSLEGALKKRDAPSVPTDLLIRLMKIILTENIFEFHDQLYRQEVGAAMGGRPVPSYANTFMADFDQIIKSLAAKYNTSENYALRRFKRFLDEYFILFTGSTSQTH